MGCIMINNIDIKKFTCENYPIKKSILRESLIRLDYVDVLDLEREDLLFSIEKELQKKNFSIIKTSTIGEVKIDLKNILSLDPSINRNSTPIDFINNRKVYVFFNKDLNIYIQISPLFSYIRQKGSFVNDSPKYYGYDNLSNVIVQVLEIINQYIPLNYTRIGIRKFNSLFSSKKTTIKNAFNKLLINDILFYPRKIKDLCNPRIEKLYNFYIDNYGVNLRNYLQVVQLKDPSGKKVDAYNFNFDIDVYTYPDLLKGDIEQSMLKNCLNNANNLLYSMFLWSLSEESREKLLNNKNITEIDL